MTAIESFTPSVLNTRSLVAAISSSVRCAWKEFPYRAADRDNSDPLLKKEENPTRMAIIEQLKFTARDRIRSGGEGQSSAIASRILTAAVIAMTRKLPSQGTSTKPVTKDPAMAPRVFAAYALPTTIALPALPPIAPSSRTRTTGKLKPKIVAIGRRVKPLVTACARTNPPNV